MNKKQKVAVIMGSVSDLKVMKPAIDLLKDWKISVEIKVVSAHRTPEFMQEYANKASSRSIQLIIAGAGGAAHLPGMVASFTSLPVIGVPISLKNLNGLDSLLSIAQMPKGAPVATMAINNSHNAALLVLRILALNNASLAKKLMIYQKKQKIKSLKSNQTLKQILKKRIQSK